MSQHRHSAVGFDLISNKGKNRFRKLHSYFFYFWEKKG